MTAFSSGTSNFSWLKKRLAFGHWVAKSLRVTVLTVALP